MLPRLTKKYTIDDLLDASRKEKMIEVDESGMVLDLCGNKPIKARKGITYLIHFSDDNCTQPDHFFKVSQFPIDSYDDRMDKVPSPAKCPMCNEDPEL